MNRKLYVNNIPWSVRNEDLKSWLKDWGFAVDDVKIIMSAEDGRSRGFGFVTFGNAEDASRALRELEGVDYLGRTLHVAEAVNKKPANDRPSGDRPRVDTAPFAPPMGRIGNGKPSHGRAGDGFQEGGEGRKKGRRGRGNSDYDDMG